MEAARCRVAMTFDRHCSTCHEHQENGVIPGDSENVSTQYVAMSVDGIGTLAECKPDTPPPLSLQPRISVTTYDPETGQWVQEPRRTTFGQSS